MATIPAFALAAVLAVAPATSCQPPAGDTGPRPASSSDVEYTASCDGAGNAFDVKPNTPAARAEAQRLCRRTHTMVRDAPWPSGWKPVPIPEGTGW
ncbi:hypothetical protein ACFORH_43135 [Amycolatopsis roodepoortensis]|uniref:Lipoprotein n=1 Tax=Amycolatopsis roodepoortensis TaxID=700274 RepID=A0ABR9LIG9_9PSEU|nr:hypothetical protein [Amycolatopsis roodepoortensis]MBE1580464.1 hypothetical protein [Amycolatopsis roodepoortensis]